MATPDDIAALRRELEGLLAQARRIEQRIDALEATPEAAPLEVAAAPEPEPARPVPVPVPVPVPPPLPVRRAAAEESTREAESVAPMATEPPAAPAWSLADGLRSIYRAIGPKESMSWEMALGTYWLPRLAVLLLAIGVVWGLTLAAQRWGGWWQPYLRLAAGYGLAAALYGGGRYFERKRDGLAAGSFIDYARVMMAGGTALVYFVTFATYYVPYTRIFADPYITLLLLTAIMAGWGFMAHRRRSATLALAVTLLGHFTAGLATLTLPEPPTATIVGLLALNLGAGYFIARFGWRLVGLAGVIGGYVNYFLWLAYSESSDSPAALAGGMAVLVAYWAIFAVAEYLASARPDVQASHRLRSLYLSLNSGGLVLLGVGLVMGFDFAEPHLYAFLFTAAAVFLAFGLLYLRTRPGDTLYSVYITKASAVAALGLADYFDGSALTVSLAVEAIVLLVAARRSGLAAPRALSMLTLALALTHGLYMAVVEDGHIGESLTYPGGLAPVLCTLLAVAVWCALHDRTTWPLIPAASLTQRPRLHRWLWRWTFAESLSASTTARPIAITAFAAFIANAHAAAQLGLLHDTWPWAAALLGMLALAQAAAAALLRAPGLSAGAIASGALGCCAWLLAGNAVLPEMPQADDSVFAAILGGALFATAEIFRLFRQTAPQPGGETERKGVAYIWMLVTAVLVITTVGADVGPMHQAVTLLAFAAAFSVYAFVSGSAQAGLAGLAIYVVGVFAGASVATNFTPAAWMPACLGLAACCALLSEASWWGTRPGLRHHQRPEVGPHLLYFGVAALAAGAVLDHAQGLNALLGLLAVAAAAVGLAFVLHARAHTFVAAAMLLWAALYWRETLAVGTDARLQGAWAVALAAIVAGRVLTRRAAYPLPVAENLLLAIAWAVLAGHYLEGEGYLVREQGVALGFLALAAITRAPAALVLSLATAVLATAGALLAAYDGGPPDATHAAALGLGALYAFLLERAFAVARARGLLPALPTLDALPPALAVAPPALLVLALERTPALGSYYLTIAWTAAAAAVMLIAVLAKQRYYRYAALAIFALALGRVAFIDTRELDGLYRVAAVMFLGVVLLGVGYGYIKARERGGK
jgi:hypothetical protein